MLYNEGDTERRDKLLTKSRGLPFRPALVPSVPYLKEITVTDFSVSFFALFKKFEV